MQPGFAPLAFGDVTHGDLDRLVVQRQQDGAGLDVCAAAVESNNLRFRGRGGVAAAQPLDALGDDEVTLGMEQVVRRLADDLIGMRRPEQACGRRVGEHDALVDREEDSVGR